MEAQTIKELEQLRKKLKNQNLPDLLRQLLYSKEERNSVRTGR
jgi:hypothetical protein